MEDEVEHEEADKWRSGVLALLLQLSRACALEGLQLFCACAALLQLFCACATLSQLFCADASLLQLLCACATLPQLLCACATLPQLF
jgi:hypothetical protein